MNRDILKCYDQLNDIQKKVVSIAYEYPELSYTELAKKLDMDSRNFNYHILNARKVFKSIYFEGKKIEPDIIKPIPKRGHYRTQIKCLETNIVYPSMSAAALAMNVSRTNVIVAIKKNYKVKGLTFVKELV
jgi:hypothetical protein